MAKSIAFINEKGGVGKTTVLYNYCGVLSEMGYKVLVIDLDKQRNTTSTFLDEESGYLGLKHEKTILEVFKGVLSFSDVVMKSYIQKRGNAKPTYSNIDVIPSNNLLKNEIMLKELNIDITDQLFDFVEEQGYDFVVVDMPPSNEMLNEICFGQMVNYILVPMSSDIYSIESYQDLLHTFNRAREINQGLQVLGIFLSRYISYCGLDKYVREQMIELIGDKFLQCDIPFDVKVRETVFFRRPINWYKPNGRGHIAYKKLVEECLEKI